MTRQGASARRWLVACAAAAVLLGSTALLLQRARPGPTPDPVDAGSPCLVSDALPARALPGAEDPPVLLWASGAVRLSFGGSPAFSPPEAPRRFAVGEHPVRVEAFGAEPLTTRVRLDPFRPALLHAQVEPNVGITLVVLGAVCSSCERPLDVVSLDAAADRNASPDALERAASALRGGDWRKAAAALRAADLRRRSGPAFHRLAAAVHASAGQPALARAELDAIAPEHSHELAPLLARLDELNRAEQAREREVVLTRWNRLTERFSAVVRRFEREAPGPVQSASARLERLSRAFEEATRGTDVPRQEELLGAAEEALMRLVRELRASRPGDCRFQADVVSTLLR